MSRTISVISPLLSVSGPPDPPERDFVAEHAADRVPLDQAAKEFFVSREAFIAAADRPDFPRGTARYNGAGGKFMVFRRSQIKAWIETQRALVSTFR